MFVSLLLLALPSLAALPLLHHINIDGFIFCPDGKAPQRVTVVVTDGSEDTELLRKVFSPADEYCLTVDDFVDVKASHPEITLYAHCLTAEKDCTYKGTCAIPTNFLDSVVPFRPTFNATATNLQRCDAF
ncbi:hypothetical protein PRIPAC_94269 [Pristionchus pacificus]|uniref:Uncharacterized protein n=1 Tax=Pristionchus pacificus TaxID=54126 RepID=A0A2A6BBB7_PRIPA|nr:hypothetical protein PRIPAC_94269 [Pristionchus pacificus]|eukprot:PDM63154.1 hypothetical protein PRIPAC_50369 [Pristionchus pacificus]